MLKHMLRKCYKNGFEREDSGHGSREYLYPLEYPCVLWPSDTNADAVQVCGLEDAQGDWGLLEGDLWQVIMYKEEAATPLANGFTQISHGVQVYIGDVFGLTRFVEEGKLNPVNRNAYDWQRVVSDATQAEFSYTTYCASREVKGIAYERIRDAESAYFWVKDVDNHAELIDLVTEPEWAFKWARDIGNKDIMIDRVTDSEWAFKWATLFGDRDIMITRVTESDWVVSWAMCLGDVDEMFRRITTSDGAYFWALTIGDRDKLIDLVTEPKWAIKWARDIGDREVMARRITDPYYALQWVINGGELAGNREHDYHMLEVAAGTPYEADIRERIQYKTRFAEQRRLTER